MSQARLEEHLQLPPSVRPSRNSLSEARGQVMFIGTFTRPLFELTARGIDRKKISPTASIHRTHKRDES